MNNPAETNIEIDLKFLCEKFRFENRNGDTIIAEAEAATSVNGGKSITIKGPAEPDELLCDRVYTFYGQWTSYTNKRTGDIEQQFSFRTFTEHPPAGRAGVVGYLLQAGQGKRIGPATADKIWRRFGEDSIRVVREEPETINRLFRIRLDYCQAVSEWLERKKKLEQITVQLTGLFAGRGFPRSIIKQVLQRWGNSSITRIKKDPYALMTFSGVGFATCDKLYLSLGLRIDRLRRQAYAAWFGIYSDSSGHTWFPVQFVKSSLNRIVGSGANLKRALKMAKKIHELGETRHGALAFSREEDGALVDSGGTLWIAEGKKASNEKRISQLVADASEEKLFWPDVEELGEGPTEHQKNNLRNALKGPIAILGGSPGTGKSWTGSLLIKRLEKVVGSGNIKVAAPTGKAAVRITDVMKENGLKYTAKTWHSLLGVDANGDNNGIWSFQKNEKDPFECKVIIGDESSMIDTDLMSHILRARRPGTHVLFLGDVNQLPPVGHGAPLRDFISAGLPYGELTKIMRNSGGIVEACAAIRDGEEWTAGDNLVIDEDPGQMETIVRRLEESEANGKDPVWECQVVVAVNKKSPLSRKAVNKVLQNEFNHNPEVKGSIFRKGDKIVCLKNGRYELLNKQPGESVEAYVANGELARVVESRPNLLIVELPNSIDPESKEKNRVIKIPVGRGDEESTGCNWDLGYALSVHKSQGSEWPVVLVVLDEYPGARRVCDRSWIYTAISRAKNKCVLIGKKTTGDAMCKRQTILSRKTFLKERLLGDLVNMELAGV